MQGLIYKSNTDHPWHLIEELPEKPYKLNQVIQDVGLRTKYDHEWQEYNKALQLAISNAVRVENQEVAKNILLRALNWNPHPDEYRFEPDKVYPVEVEYEIIEVPEYPIDHTSYPPMRNVARLIPYKEEGRDLWTEVEEKVKQSQWFALDVVRYLKENYNITRKQQ